MVKLSYTVALIVHHTNRSYKYDNYRTSGDGAGTVRDVIEPAVPIKKIMKELIFLFYGPVRQKKKARQSTGKVCQMTSPALFLRTAFMEENRVKKSRQSYDKSRPQLDRSGDHTERIPPSLNN